MTRLALNKSSLSREKSSLDTFQRFLPSLDLKRRQLIAERAKAQAALADIENGIGGVTDQIGHALPMLANQHISIEGMVKLAGMDVGEENILGARLPFLKGVNIDVVDYGLLLMPHWVDRYIELAHDMIELRARQHVQRQRLDALELAVRKVTQRVNLFDKVLIPKTRDNIKRIQIYLSDSDRAAVVRSKIAKAKNEKAKQADQSVEGAPS